MWKVLQKWILALPVATPEQRSRRLDLQQELRWVVSQLDDGNGIGEDGVSSSQTGFNLDSLLTYYQAGFLALRSAVRKRDCLTQRQGQSDSG